jgi:uncharacterized membrane protein YdbT with pleckstrin-like domain
MSTSPEEQAVFPIHRPDPALLKYYILGSLLAGPLFFVPLIPLYFRYHTMRYEFDREGISMQWGLLFRRQITLTYARIQDIHLVSNLIERWLGLARIQIQTASGSAAAEMTIEGIRQFEMVRDYLYKRMRGVHTPAKASDPMQEVADEMRRIRELLVQLLEKRP